MARWNLLSTVSGRLHNRNGLSPVAPGCRQPRQLVRRPDRSPLSNGAALSTGGAGAGSGSAPGARFRRPARGPCPRPSDQNAPASG